MKKIILFTVTIFFLKVLEIKGQVSESTNAITSSSSFLGTSNNYDVLFKRYNFSSGLINDRNTFFGYKTPQVTTPYYNTGFGAYALSLLTSSATGGYNTAIGFSSMKNFNGANGGNTALGSESLSGIVDNSSSNVAIGYRSMQNQISAINNTAVGTYSLRNSIGQNNVSLGYDTMTLANDGSNNVVIGSGAVRSNLNPSNNVIVGTNSFKYSQGNGNIALGNNAAASALIQNGDSNILIGNSSIITDSSTSNIIIGNSSGFYNSSLLYNRLNIASTIYGIDIYNRRSTDNIGSGTYGKIGINKAEPGNTLEINTGNVSNASGLRFTNLKNTSPAITNTTNKVLSVDANGDVILVNDIQGTGGTGGTTTITAGTNISVSGDVNSGYTISSPYQSLTLSGNELSLTNGGSVTLPVATDINIYEDNGTITPADGTRTVTMNNNNLIFDTTGSTTNGRIYMGAQSSFPITTGDYRLYVEGGVLTEKVKVALRSTANWADYVFDENYKLMPLTEVEIFINENKHLPNVPSAENLVNEGLDVAEMQSKQMEKIEELTLYTIQQQKQLEKQKQEIDELKKQIKFLLDKKI